LKPVKYLLLVYGEHLAVLHDDPAVDHRGVHVGAGGVVDDVEDDVLLLVRQLKKGGYNPTYKQVDTAKAMSEALDQQTWDAILCDYSMPNFSASAALELYKEKGFDVYLAGDACGARDQNNHESALDMMRQFDIFIASSEMLVFQILHTANDNKYGKVMKIVRK